jgi:hypothetical protein
MSSVDIASLLDGQDKSRTFKRFKTQFTILVTRTASCTADRVRPAGSKITAIVTDISVNGLCFHTPVWFDIESQPLMDITIGIQTFSVPIIVRRCIELERPGRYVYACGAQYVISEDTSKFIPALGRYLIIRNGAK